MKARTIAHNQFVIVKAHMGQLVAVINLMTVPVRVETAQFALVRLTARHPATAIPGIVQLIAPAQHTQVQPVQFVVVTHIPAVRLLMTVITGLYVLLIVTVMLRVTIADVI